VEYLKNSLAFYLLLFNAAFLCWYFITLYIAGSVIVSEPNQFIAGGEVVFTFATVAFALERLFRQKRYI